MNARNNLLQIIGEMWAERNPDNVFDAKRCIDAVTAFETEVRKQAVIEGLTMYAWWKDGVQYVGTSGTKLENVISRIKGGADG